MHANTDEDGFVKKMTYTPGNVHDSQEFDKLLDIGTTKTCGQVYADSAYANKKNDKKLGKQNPNLHENLPSIRCVGYRQAWQHLEGEITKNEMIEYAIIATRQLCKRQNTWLKNEKNALLLEKIDMKTIMDFI
jgi:hypothetical protein